MKQTQILYGAALILGSELMFALLSALIKVLSQDVSQIQMVFFRNMFALLPLLPWLSKQRLSGIKTTKLHLHLIRAGAGLSAMFIYFYAITNTNLANAAMVLMLAPFFIPLLARIWLKQPQNIATLSAVLIGFVGVLLCLYAKIDNVDTNISNELVGLIMVGAVLIAISKTTISKMTHTESSQRIVFYFTFLSFLISGLLLPFAWQDISLANLGLLVLLGFGAVAAQLMMTKAFRMAPAANIGLLSYSSILFAALFGAIWWQEIPPLQWYIGASIIISAGVVSIFYGAKKA